MAKGHSCWLIVLFQLAFFLFVPANSTTRKIFSKIDVDVPTSPSASLFPVATWPDRNSATNDFQPNTDGQDDDDFVMMKCTAKSKNKFQMTDKDCTEACNSANPGGCPSDVCSCELDGDGVVHYGWLGDSQSPSLQRCYTISITDRHAHLRVELRGVGVTGMPLRLLGVTATSKGPRLPTEHRHDLGIGGPGVARLERAAWRRRSGALDDGEWVGPWTLCVLGDGARGRAPAKFAISAVASRCPADGSARVCSGNGFCGKRERSCAPPLQTHTCFEPVCECDPGWGGPDCAEPSATESPVSGKTAEPTQGPAATTSEPLPSTLGPTPTPRETAPPDVLELPRAQPSPPATSAPPHVLRLPGPEETPQGASPAPRPRPGSIIRPVHDAPLIVPAADAAGGEKRGEERSHEHTDMLLQQGQGNFGGGRIWPVGNPAMTPASLGREGRHQKGGSGPASHRPISVGGGWAEELRPRTRSSFPDDGARGSRERPSPQGAADAPRPSPVATREDGRIRLPHKGTVPDILKLRDETIAEIHQRQPHPLVEAVLGIFTCVLILAAAGFAMLNCQRRGYGRSLTRSSPPRTGRGPRSARKSSASEL